MEEAEFLSAVNSVIRNLKTKQTNLSYSITGSSVFAILGIRPWDTVKDIDIILYNPTKETLSLLDSISTTTSNNTYPSKSLISIDYINNSNKPIKIDIFISDPDLESIPKIFYKEHPIIKIPEILKAKKSYNRDKDKLDIMNIVKFFLNSI
jgi:hypothetical protein